MQSLSIQTNLHNNHNYLFTRDTDILSVITINLFGMVVQSLTKLVKEYNEPLNLLTLCIILSGKEWETFGLLNSLFLGCYIHFLCSLSLYLILASF